MHNSGRDQDLSRSGMRTSWQYVQINSYQNSLWREKYRFSKQFPVHKSYSIFGYIPPLCRTSTSRHSKSNFIFCFIVKSPYSLINKKKKKNLTFVPIIIPMKINISCLVHDIILIHSIATLACWCMAFYSLSIVCLT